MALQKQIDFENGVLTPDAYIVITNININYEAKHANVNVSTYLNKETKDAGLNSMTTEYLIISDNNNMIPMQPVNQDAEPIEPVLNFTKYFATGDTKINAETYLLTLDKYSDCIKVA